MCSAVCMTQPAVRTNASQHGCLQERMHAACRRINQPAAATCPGVAVIQLLTNRPEHAAMRPVLFCSVNCCFCPQTSSLAKACSGRPQVTSRLFGATTTTMVLLTSSLVWKLRLAPLARITWLPLSPFSFPVTSITTMTRVMVRLLVLEALPAPRHASPRKVLATMAVPHTSALLAGSMLATTGMPAHNALLVKPPVISPVSRRHWLIVVLPPASASMMVLLSLAQWVSGCLLLTLLGNLQLYCQHASSRTP